MTGFSPARRRQVGLAAALVAGFAGWSFSVFDTPSVTLVVCAAALLWSSREGTAWLLAGGMVLAAVLWSRSDPVRCSGWWRGRIVYEKLAGRMHYLGWREVRRVTVSPCWEVRRPKPEWLETVRRLDEKVVEGHPWELYETTLGKFWIPSPGDVLLPWLIWEVTIQGNYTSGSVRIRPGDTVIDAGAHVGVFTAYALRQGADLVVAIEPDPTNIACLEANFASEIADGRVRIVKAGLWHEPGKLALHVSPTNSARHSLVAEAPEFASSVEVPVLPLDTIVADTGLDRVDFIKMDIEGAERKALRGAKTTVRRFRPRMAICSYHVQDDLTAIPSVVGSIVPGYRIHAKDVEFVENTLLVKALFFE